MTNEGNKMRPKEAAHVRKLQTNAQGKAPTLYDTVERRPLTGERNQVPAIADMRDLLR